MWKAIDRKKKENRFLYRLVCDNCGCEYKQNGIPIEFLRPQGENDDFHGWLIEGAMVDEVAYCPKCIRESKKKHGERWWGHLRYGEVEES